MLRGIFRNWNFMRALRLVLGVAIILQAIVLKDWSVVVLGIVFTSLPVFNIGCCGTGACYVPPKKSSVETKDITYEELG